MGEGRCSKAAVMEMKLVSRTTCKRKHLVVAASVSAGMEAVLPSAAAGGRFNEQPYRRIITGNTDSIKSAYIHNAFHF